MLHHYITAHEQTQSNRVCYFRLFDVFLAFRVKFKIYKSNKSGGLEDLVGGGGNIHWD